MLTLLISFMVHWMSFILSLSGEREREREREREGGGGGGILPPDTNLLDIKFIENVK